MCNRGDQTCPGNVPLDINTQCKSHRILARVKAKMAAASAEGALKCRLGAVKTEKDFYLHPRQGKCSKECCILVLPKQVANNIIKQNTKFTILQNLDG